MLHPTYSTSLKMRRSTSYHIFYIFSLLRAGQGLEANPKLICLEGVDRFSVGESVHHYYDCNWIIIMNLYVPTDYLLGSTGVPRLTECPDGLYYNSGREVRNTSIFTVNHIPSQDMCQQKGDGSDQS